MDNKIEDKIQAIERSAMILRSTRIWMFFLMLLVGVLIGASTTWAIYRNYYDLNAFRRVGVGVHVLDAGKATELEMTGGKLLKLQSLKNDEGEINGFTVLYGKANF